jgi:hypothetical protein
MDLFVKYLIHRTRCIKIQWFSITSLSRTRAYEKFKMHIVCFCFEFAVVIRAGNSSTHTHTHTHPHPHAHTHTPTHTNTHTPKQTHTPTPTHAHTHTHTHTHTPTHTHTHTHTHTQTHTQPTVLISELKMPCLVYCHAIFTAALLDNKDKRSFESKIIMEFVEFQNAMQKQAVFPHRNVIC